MSLHLAGIARSFRSCCAPSLLLLAVPLLPAAAQVVVSVQGGVHAARLDRPERVLVQPGQGIAIEGAKGEATTFGLRLGVGSRTAGV